MSAPAKTQRGTTNRNDRGSSYDRRARRAFLLTAFGDGVTCRCYRCGAELDESTVTADRITPGCDGGRYTRDNIRPACGACNSETGGSLAARRPVVIGVDPGMTTGLAVLGPGLAREVAQVSAGATMSVVRGLIAAVPDGLGVHVAVERFVVGRRAAASSDPRAGQTTRELIGRVLELATPHPDAPIVVVQRSAAEVKPWATDERLRAAQLYAEGMRHARDAGRHALFAARSDLGFPDPLSRSTSSPRCPR